MSGRVRVTLPDGRRVTGYRKTLAVRAPRKATHELPDYTVSIILRGKSVRPGETFGIMGVETPRHDHVIVSGRNKDWCVGQMRKFLKRIDVPRQQATLTREDEPGPTASGPVRKGYSRVMWIETYPSPGRYLEKDENGVLGLRELPLFELNPMIDPFG
jgi:hypothetical protein